MNLVDLLEQCSPAREIIGIVLGAPWGTARLRGTCRATRVLFRAPPRTSPDSLLMRAARDGNIAVCHVAHEHGGLFSDEMLRHGARGGHLKVCKLAIEWGARKSNDMLYAALKSGDLDCCILARQSGAEQSENTILGRAARYGHIHLCEWALSIGATDVELLLKNGAYSGNIAICKYAREKGARDYDAMLGEAASGGHIDICELAFEWGATDIEEALIEATECERTKICHFLHEHGVTDAARMLEAAAGVGNASLCELAIKWGAQNLHVLIEYSKRSETIAELARRLGVLNFEDRFMAAARADDAELCTSMILDGARNRTEAIACAALLGNERALSSMLRISRGHHAIALKYSARGGHVHICRLVCDLWQGSGEYFSISQSDMLIEGARAGNAEICILARAWGMRKYSRMLRAAREAGHQHICDLAQAWIDEEHL